MDVISVWQPWASLIVLNHKFIETRPWPAPKSIIGKRIGIASTVRVIPPQLHAYRHDDFQKFYRRLKMPPIEELPMGKLLGTVFVHSCEMISEQTLEEITDEEYSFGIYERGRFAWHLRDPQPFEQPIPVRGKQGIWKYEGPTEAEATGVLEARTAEIRCVVRNA